MDLASKIIKECADQIPTNWSDPIFDVAGDLPWGCQKVERLLLAIKERILSRTTEKE